MTPETGGDECFTDFALQEYIVGRLDAGVRRELEEHVAACGECRGAMRALEAESRLLQRALAPTTALKSDEEVSVETLGLYLSGALDDSRGARLEEALSRQPVLLGRLVALSREVGAVQTEASAVGYEAKPVPPEGHILKMRRRTAPPVTIFQSGRLQGGMGI